jgi:hypothetical protein
MAWCFPLPPERAVCSSRRKQWVGCRRDHRLPVPRQRAPGALGARVPLSGGWANSSLSVQPSQVMSARSARRARVSHQGPGASARAPSTHWEQPTSWLHFVIQPRRFRPAWLIASTKPTRDSRPRHARHHRFEVPPIRRRDAQNSYPYLIDKKAVPLSLAGRTCVPAIRADRSADRPRGTPYAGSDGRVRAPETHSMPKMSRRLRDRDSAR